jgi:hypothetical protein
MSKTFNMNYIDKLSPEQLKREKDLLFEGSTVRVVLPDGSTREASLEEIAAFKALVNCPAGITPKIVSISKDVEQ